jgi:two-component system OmpR family sensor kinase
VIAPRSLRWRLAAWTFAAIAGLAVLLTVYYERRAHALLSRVSIERLEALAQGVAAVSVLGALARSEELLANPLEAAMSQPDVEAVAIYDSDGALIAGRSRDPTVLLAWQPGSGECRPCRLGGDRLRWVSPVISAPARTPLTPAPLDAPPPAAAGGDATAGWLVLDVSNQARLAEERRITASGLLIAGAALLLALVVTLALAQGLTSPLRALAQATRAIGQGRWDAPLPRAASSEIAQLAADFHAMTAALADLDRENRRYREHLEEMVAHRTRELEEAYGRMKAMAEAKDQFVATVSHDFRSPLAIILSAVQTVLADPEMRDDVRRQFLARAERQCKRLGTLVSDLLDLARIENRDAAFERLDLAGVVEESIDGARSAFDERRVSLVWEPPRDAISAEVDRGQVGRAIANLVDNALKFTPAGGRVTVELRDGGGEALLAVTDTGPGIPEDEREHVFERFYQGREGQALGRGSGLGLAIVAGVARRHGGSVAVTSAKGAGSRFELRLPVARG